MQKSFLSKLQDKWVENKFVCVGLDSDYAKIPATFKNDSIAETIINFNVSVIDQTADLVCAYKPNSAFYESYGVEGLTALEKTVSYIKQKYPEISVILDAKRGDIGNTNDGYVKAFFDEMNVDATTVHPYLGKQSLQPFLDRKDKGIIILIKTSNPGSSELQDLIVEGKPLYQVIAEHAANSWNTNGNCAVVVGATYPKELKKVREIIGDMPILIPGIGAQGGDLEATVESGKNSKNQGIIINSSRGIIFDANPRNATLKLHEEIVSYLT